MKQILCSIMVLGVITTTYAQSITVQGGATFSNITSTDKGNVEDNNMLTTFHVGATIDIPVNDLLGFQTGLIFSGKGAKARTDFGNDNYIEAKFNPYYLEIPASLKLKFPFGVNNRFFIHAGPYAAIGIGGKSKIYTQLGGLTIEKNETIKFSNDNPLTSEEEDAGYDKLKRFDYGLQGGVGVDLSKFRLYINGSLGLAKINSGSDNNADDKNKLRVIQIGIGIPIGK